MPFCSFSNHSSLFLSLCLCVFIHSATLLHWISHSQHPAWNMLITCVERHAACICPHVFFSYLCPSIVALVGCVASSESVPLALSAFTDPPAIGTHHGPRWRLRVTRQCTRWSGARSVALYTGVLSWTQQTSAHLNQSENCT